MQTHIASVRSRRIAWDVREVVQHGLNADAVVLDLDAEWRECDRVVAVLAKTGAQAFRVDARDGFFIPSALMEETGPLRMCLIGYAGDSLRVVTAKEVSPLVVVESGETGGMDPTPEQPDLWAQLMEEVRKATDGAKTAAQSATRAEADLRAAAERGDFDGEDGKTPVRGVDYWTAEDRKPIEDATLAATTAAGRADAAAEKASVGEASRVAAEAERVNAETARAKAEQDRETAETGRVEAEMGRVAADAERGQRVDASVQKADAATAKATEAAGKAIASATEADAAAKRADEAARGASENVLVGTKTAGVVHVEDAYPAQLRECKVLGKSVQDGTPTHDAPKPIESVRKAEVVVAGRNLLPRFTVVSSESKGFRYRLLEDGGVEYAGVGNTGTSYFYPYGTTLDSTDSIFTLPKGTYTVSSVKGVPMLFGMRGRVGDGPVKTITGASINNPGSPTSTFTLDGDTQITHVQFTVNVGAGSGVQYVNLEYGRSASGYEPHVPPVSTAIDLKGRELRSLPNGVRDELAVGSDGSAKLTVRTGRGAWRCSSVDRGADKNYAKCRFPDLGANYSPVISERAVNNTGGEFGTCYVNAKMVYVVVPQEVTTPEQADALYGGMQVVYQLAEPQAVELGMVEVPSIKTPTANLWNADPVATEVSATYVRDVTLAISNIEDKINSAVAAIPLLAAAAL